MAGYIVFDAGAGKKYVVSREIRKMHCGRGTGYLYLAGKEWKGWEWMMDGDLGGEERSPCFRSEEELGRSGLCWMRSTRKRRPTRRYIVFLPSLKDRLLVDLLVTSI